MAKKIKWVLDGNERIGSPVVHQPPKFTWLRAGEIAHLVEIVKPNRRSKPKVKVVAPVIIVRVWGTGAYDRCEVLLDGRPHTVLCSSLRPIDE